MYRVYVRLNDWARHLKFITRPLTWDEAEAEAEVWRDRGYLTELHPA